VWRTASLAPGSASEAVLFVNSEMVGVPPASRWAIAEYDVDGVGARRYRERTALFAVVEREQAAAVREDFDGSRQARHAMEDGEAGVLGRCRGGGCE